MNKYETRQRNNQTEGLKEEYSGHKERGFYTLAGNKLWTWPPKPAGFIGHAAASPRKTNETGLLLSL